ncbi:MAG: single-stranded-DNA-specific exonuclease RecJ [Acidobacteriota bacterium]|nr:single-stranded-DNA-specific exonuclease RecJ [Acidobacteriota bacterium]
MPPSAETLLAAGVAPRLAPLLARRGVETEEAARRFFSPSLEDLHDPFLMLGMDRATARLRSSRDTGEKVAIVGDYDVDGVTGTALLTVVLRACGIDVEPVLPNRLVDGYGFQETQVHKARGLGCTLIVTVDCGTTSTPAVAAAQQAGIDVVVTDHHIPSPDLPQHAIQINPRQQGCEYPFRDLSGVGLALKLGQGVAAVCGRELPTTALLRVACLGTIADLVPLVGENRVIASLGLEALRRTRSCGLRALIRNARLTPPFRASDVGFRLGPRINAAGRLSTPDHALELLLTRDPDRASELADELEQCNTARRAEEHKVVEEARAAIDERDELPGILVEWAEGWHRGVVGIAASRIARQFHRPTLLLAVQDDLAVGSGRSIPGIALYDFLKQWDAELDRFGGHPQAVGMTVARNRLESLRAAWEQAAKWPEEVLQRRYEYELELKPEEVDQALFDELNTFQPHGMGNPHPVLRVGPLEVQGGIKVFGQGHRKARAVGPNGGDVRLLAWTRDEASMVSLEGTFEVLGQLEWDSYSQVPVFEVTDSRPAA